jgi:hypothetical protein
MKKVAPLAAVMLLLSATFLHAEETKPPEKSTSSSARKQKASEKKETKKAADAATSAKFSDASAPVEAASQDDSPLVKAAKSHSGHKSRIVIDDSTVKSSKGKLIEMTSTIPQKPIPMPPSALDEERHRKEKQQAGTENATNRIERARQRVAEIEKELGRLEEDYYSEDQDGTRDVAIAGRFEASKKQLENARKELTEATAGAGQSNP